MLKCAMPNASSRGQRSLSFRSVPAVDSLLLVIMCVKHNIVHKVAYLRFTASFRMKI